MIKIKCEFDPNLFTKVKIGWEDRAKKIKWLRKNVKENGRFEYMHLLRPDELYNRGHQITEYVYLTKDELLIYKLMFGIENDYDSP